MRDRHAPRHNILNQGLPDSAGPALKAAAYGTGEWSPEMLPVDTSIASTAMAAGARKPVFATSVTACQAAPRTANDKNAHGRMPAVRPPAPRH